MAINSNFPRIEYGWGAMWDASNGSSPIDRFVNVSGRTQGTAGTGRGRQYETDQVQTGTFSATLGNNDGALDPTNASGPWFGHISPYQPYRVRAQWPPTRNLLSPALASAEGLPLGPAGLGVTGPGMFGLNPAVAASASAYVGSQVWQATVPAGIAAFVLVLDTPQAAVTPGQAYSFSVRVRVVTDAVNPTLHAAISWMGPVVNGPSLSSVSGADTVITGSSTATTWTTLTVSGTAPSTVFGMNVSVAVGASIASGYTLQADGWQLEESAAPTAYADPGAWYPMLSGYVERWPQTWLQGQTYSVVQPTAVDAFALLSQRPLFDPLTEEINSHSPRFLYQLDDPQDSGQATDVTGNFGPASVNSGKFGKGSLTFGNSVTATDPVNGVFTGGSGTVCSVANGSPGTSLYDKASFIDLSTAGITGPADPAGDWARMIAFRYTGPRPAVGAESVFWCSLDRSKNGSGAAMSLLIDSTGKLAFSMSGSTGTAFNLTPVSFPVDDGNWHLVIISFRGASLGVTVNVDGTGAGTTASAGAIPSGLISDSIGARAEPVLGNQSVWNFKGDLAFAAEFNSFLPDQAIFDLQAAWRNSFTGDSTDQRYSRILKYAGYAGAQDIKAGVTRSMGPAEISGQDALSALADVVTTEGGTHFVSAAGHVTFLPRSYRYNAADPVAVFGEHELPYESCDFDYDPTHLGNVVDVTQLGTGQVFSAFDAASQKAYFPRTISRSVNASDPYECQDAAWYLVSRYKDPATRVTALVLNPSSNPALWAACLSLELNALIRIVRRPLGRPAITVDVFVEHIQWDLDDQNNARLTLQCSPTDPTVYGSFAAWHSTLSAGASAGASSFTINAGQDNTNPAASQLALGQPLLLSPGTANQELITVNGVSTTTAGWAMATISTVVPLTHNHLSGDVVCENLPAGVTDPTTWDSVSAFDSVAFVY